MREKCNVERKEGYAEKRKRICMQMLRRLYEVCVLRFEIFKDCKTFTFNGVIKDFKKDFSGKFCKIFHRTLNASFSKYIL